VIRPVGAKFEQAEQNLVSLGFDLREDARSDLGMDAVYELLLDLRSKHRRAAAPPRR
jgi:hypothetical protein